MKIFFSKEIAKALFSRKKDREIQIKSLKMKEMNPKLKVFNSEKRERLQLKSWRRPRGKAISPSPPFVG
jgi:ribosomal protein L32E